MKKTTARVIVNTICRRDCAYCCNKSTAIMRRATPIYTVKPLNKFEVVCITGGEPMLLQHRLRVLIKGIKQLPTFPKIYIYMADYDDIRDVEEIAYMVDGFTWTVHAKATQDDLDKFRAVQSIAFTMPELSWRLKLHHDCPLVLPLMPRAWKFIKQRPFFTLDKCTIPGNEKLFIVQTNLEEELDV